MGLAAIVYHFSFLETSSLWLYSMSLADNYLKESFEPIGFSILVEDFRGSNFCALDVMEIELKREPYSKP